MLFIANKNGTKVTCIFFEPFCCLPLPLINLIKSNKSWHQNDKCYQENSPPCPNLQFNMYTNYI